ncbi:conjugative relaxosome accessory transposon family protein [Escherichia coli 7-233-03_S3_C3]|nr:conjugative relaxosome accessory transposon family protein [Escherichia coli 7-233-03_S3_C3]
MQRFVKQIMSNAAGYFFDLALQTTVPEIKTAKDFLQKMASDINSMNLSSCQVAQYPVCLCSGGTGADVV